MRLGVGNPDPRNRPGQATQVDAPRARLALAASSGHERDRPAVNFWTLNDGSRRGLEKR